MEVHLKHVNRDKKREWKEYIIDFLMILCAILLGFFSENLRDKQEDRIEEKEYMYSMLNDLKEDTLNLNITLKNHQNLIAGLDTLLNYLASPVHSPTYAKLIYAYSIQYTYWFIQPDFSELTIVQLKNGGGLRTISNSKVLNDILLYDIGRHNCDNSYANLYTYLHVVEATQKDLLDFSYAKPLYDLLSYDAWTTFYPWDKVKLLISDRVKLKTYSPNELSKYYDDVLFYQSTLSNTYSIVNQQKLLADSLIKTIRAEYKIHGE